MQRVRESLALLLIAFLPLHALLVTVGTKMIVGPGHAPLMILAMWKEGVILVLFGLVVLEWIFGQNSRVKMSEKYQRVMVRRPAMMVRDAPSLRSGAPHHDMAGRLEPSRWYFSQLSIDCLDLCIIGLLLIAVVLSYRLPLTAYRFLVGFKYTLFPLLLFFIFRRVAWSQGFVERALKILVGVGIAVALYGIITFFLPMKFFMRLGYSDLHSLYLPGSPLAAFQQIGEMGLRRIQSTFSGPNQMGVWLLIPLGILFMRIRSGRRGILEYWNIGILGTALVMTFSRAAWVGAGVMIFWIMCRCYQPFRVVLRGSFGAPQHDTEWTKNAILIMTIVCVGGGIFLFVLFPQVFLRTESTLDHIRRPVEAMRVIMANPLGLGLGSAGPASNRVSDPCVYLAKGADTSWAKDRRALCIFVGESQVQPEEPCQCPLLSENWYLQVGVELGIVGLVLFVILVVLVLKQWSVGSFQWSMLSFMGISVAALFLHAWEDSAVAYTVWMLLAAALPVAPWRRGS